MLWDAISGDCLHALEGPQTGGIKPHFCVTEKNIIGVYGNGTVLLWDRITGAGFPIRLGENYYLFHSCFNPLGTRLITETTTRTETSICSCGTAKMWDVEILAVCVAWLRGQRTLEEALLLHCIYQGALVYWLSKKRGEAIVTRFDFSQYPHLETIFNNFPKEIQGILEPFIARINP